LILKIDGFACKRNMFSELKCWKREEELIVIKILEK